MELQGATVPDRRVEAFEASAVTLLRLDRAFISEGPGIDDEETYNARYAEVRAAEREFYRLNPTPHERDVAWTWATMFEGYVR